MGVEATSCLGEFASQTSRPARPAPFGLFPVLTAWVSTPRTVSFFKPLHRFIRIIHLTPLPSPSSTPLKMTRGGRRCLNRFLIRKHYPSCAFQGGEKMKPIFRSSPLAAPSKNSLHFFINATRGFRRLRTASVSRSAEREEGFTPSTRASF